MATKEPVMYAIAYKCESESWVNFVTEGVEMELSFANMLPSKALAENYIRDVLCDDYIVVPVTLISYDNGTTVMKYNDPWS